MEPAEHVFRLRLYLLSLILNIVAKHRLERNHYSLVAIAYRILLDTVTDVFGGLPLAGWASYVLHCFPRSHLLTLHNSNQVASSAFARSFAFA